MRNTSWVGLRALWSHGLGREMSRMHVFHASQRRKTLVVCPATHAALANWYSDDRRGSTSQAWTGEGWRLGGRPFRTVVYAVLIALVVRTFAIGPHQHPLGLDDPDLAGRRLPVRLEILVRLQQAIHSLFHSASFSGRIFGRVPERGDVAVFKYPGDQGQGINRTDYIKRIVGLPGDRIQVINGDPADQRQAGRAHQGISDYVQGGSGGYRTGTLYREVLPNGRAHEDASRPATTDRPTTRRSSWSPPTATS